MHLCLSHLTRCLLLLSIEASIVFPCFFSVATTMSLRRGVGHERQWVARLGTVGGQAYVRRPAKHGDLAVGNFVAGCDSGITSSSFLASGTTHTHHYA
ncbi:hypothetical protein K466DRAFT_581941 [Polyporus arcularius HHB13444]|uniref:Secreted protein n=1 Tax=Polyporus arcularius HHB13444 TaxID=1314778 RepID=A0A5C3PVE0_9APHY|nr:hypothetical protein K466DRAFT_581941 [Polyporus arcularius HHB13444]